jgi:hypothetical protein
MISSEFLICRYLPGLFFQHYRDIVPDRIGQTIGFAYQFAGFLIVDQGAFANRASQYIQ